MYQIIIIQILSLYSSNSKFINYSKLNISILYCILYCNNSKSQITPKNHSKSQITPKKCYHYKQQLSIFKFMIKQWIQN